MPKISSYLSYTDGVSSAAWLEKKYLNCIYNQEVFFLVDVLIKTIMVVVWPNINL